MHSYWSAHFEYLNVAKEIASWYWCSKKGSLEFYQIFIRDLLSQDPLFSPPKTSKKFYWIKGRMEYLEYSRTWNEPRSCFNLWTQDILNKRKSDNYRIGALVELVVFILSVQLLTAISKPLKGPIDYIPKEELRSFHLPPSPLLLPLLPKFGISYLASGHGSHSPT